MKNKLATIITKNFGIKLLCVVASSMLWIYVISIQNTVAKFPSDINIKERNLQEDLVAVYDQKSVEVKIMAEPAAWQRLSAESFSAFLDLSGYKEGTYEIPVNVSINVSDVQVVAKSPEKILVTLEKMVSKEVPISANLEGNAATGRVAGNIEFSPSTVTVSGPKSVIDQVNEVVALIQLNGEEKDFTRLTPLTVTDVDGTVLRNVTLSAKEAEADISIVKGSNIKTVGIKAKITGQPASGYTVSGITVSPQIIDITGNRDSIEDILYIETEPIDINNTSNTIEKDVPLDLPSGITLLSGYQSKAKVRITFSNQTALKQLDVSNFKTTNLGQYSVLSYSPQVVSIQLAGPAATIGTITDKDIALVLDFTGKVPDENGMIEFSLNDSDFAIPQNCTISSLSPKGLNVKVGR